ncbi:MAG: glycosyltransferase [Candidatus Moranbacteria bacterium]|nr:glycosyltransferase [Candidatus Moranbacteria bacterium]MDD3964944.1 glycosyltransferase [Candidatus Moranbacteria bacterium]
MSEHIYNPILSVVVAVFNGERFLSEAIDSILSQTYDNFELLIINDGSTDDTEKIIQNYTEKDGRIVYIKNNVNLRQSRSWNRGIKIAKGQFIIRMDADDICLPDRFEKQYQYMLLHPNIGVLGSHYYIFSNNKEKKAKNAPFFSIIDGRPPVHHPTCCIRKELFEKFGYYDSRYDNAEDTELWYRFYSRGVEFSNLDDYLLLYRVHENNVSIKKQKKQVYLQLKINLLAVFKYRIKFSLKGYLRILEQFFYLIYLSFGLDKIYQRGNTSLK